MRAAGFCALQLVLSAVLQRVTLMKASFEGVLVSKGCARVGSATRSSRKAVHRCELFHD